MNVGFGLCALVFGLLPGLLRLLLLVIEPGRKENQDQSPKTKDLPPPVVY